MGIGPFTTYAPPGVYTRTTAEPAVGQLIGGLRVPVLIGTGKESLSQTDFEIIRGSSSVADTPIFGEDVSGRWMTGGTNQNPLLGQQTGSQTKFRVRNYPIVDGGGTGKTTFDASKVSCTVNGQQVVVAQLDGTNGIVTLLIPPEATDSVAINYYFHRKDTRVTDDVSQQVTTTAAILIAPKVEPYTIVSGQNTLYLYLNDSTTSTKITITPGTRAATEIANDINAASVPGLTASVHTDNQGLSHVQIVAQGNLQVTSDSPNVAQDLGFNPGDYTARNKTFRVFNGPIVDGSDGGITTTDTSKVVVMVAGKQVIASSVDGANRLVTLPYAPNAGSLVTVQYYFNTFQDTYDYLPNSNIINVGNVGIAPGRNDYFNGTDFIVVNDKDQSRINWGTAFQVLGGIQTGTVPFDSVQVTGSLVDNRIYGVQCERYTDPVTSTVSTTKFVLPLVPTTGNGRDTPLGSSLYQTITNSRIDLPTNRPDLVICHVGKNFRDANLRPPVVVLAVESSDGTVTLRDPVPADYEVFATFWYNTIADESYILDCTVPGSSGVGQFTVVKSSDNSSLYKVSFGTKTGLPQTVQWPSGVERVTDAVHYGGTPVAETVTITFNNAINPATHASFSNANPEPYDIYTATKNFGVMKVNGISLTVDLSVPFKAQLLSDPISNPGAMTFLSTDYLVLSIDGVAMLPAPMSGITTLAGAISSINDTIDSDTQVHTDGSPTFSSASGFDTVITLANDLRTQFLNHRNNGPLGLGGYHTPADTNAGSNVTAPVCTDLPTALTLLNQIRAAFILHLSYTPEHGTADPGHIITAPVATGVASALALANDIQTQYDLHIVDVTLIPPIHAAADLADGTTAPAAGPIVSLALARPAVVYGTQDLLLVRGRNVQTETNGLISSIQVLSPTAAGQTDAAATLGLTPSQLVTGSWNALNQPAFMVGANSEPYTITAAVNDKFLFTVDGADYSATLPSGTVTLLDAVNYINAGYAITAPAADQALMLADAIALVNDLRTQYTNHGANAPGAYHTNPDTVNLITAPVATDLTTALALANDIKAIYEAHRQQIVIGILVIHGSVDTTDALVAPVATDLRSLLILAYDIKSKFNAHIINLTGAPPIHALIDAAHTEVLSLTQIVAQAGAGQYAGLMILRSRVNGVTSGVGVSIGTANSKLGFTNNTNTARHQPTAGNLAGALNADAAFHALAAAWTVLAPGLGYFLRIDSLMVGSASTISFVGGASTVFMSDTNIGIIPGTSGDVGEPARSGYAVSSSNPLGSSGTGTPGQTYTDAVTGLRFTIMPLNVGDYTSTGSFTLIVSSVFTCDASLPFRAIPGVETIVYNTTNVGADSTAILTTYSRTGAEPQIGDVYYISYDYAKTDLATALYRDQKKIQVNFGIPTPSNPLSLGARLAMLNGTVLIGLKQVLRSTGSSQASVQSYIDAIDEQKKPISNSVKPDVLVPLATDPQIFAYLNQHCVFMSAPRQEGERTGIVGCAAGTSSLGVQTIAKSLLSEVMVVAYPDIFVISVVDDQGNSVDQIVDGSFCAAALAGGATNPTLDVATPWTRRQISGFKSIGRVLDPTEANQIAVTGVTVIEQIDTGLRIRHGLTTRMETVITRTPSVTLIIQHVQQSMRAVLDPFIGQKFTSSLLKSAEGVITGLFSNLISQQIVAQVAGISATVDENDPTIMRTEAIYVPIFPLEYIMSTMNIRIRI